MPDFTIEYRWICYTIEYRWICQAYHDWASLPSVCRAETPEPECRWNEEYDEGEPIDGTCPVCGGLVTSYRIAT